MDNGNWGIDSPEYSGVEKRPGIIRRVIGWLAAPAAWILGKVWQFLCWLFSPAKGLSAGSNQAAGRSTGKRKKRKPSKLGQHPHKSPPLVAPAGNGGPTYVHGEGQPDPEYLAWLAQIDMEHQRERQIQQMNAARQAAIAAENAEYYRQQEAIRKQQERAPELARLAESRWRDREAWLMPHREANAARLQARAEAKARKAQARQLALGPMMAARAAMRSAVSAARNAARKYGAFVVGRSRNTSDAWGNSQMRSWDGTVGSSVQRPPSSSTSRRSTSRSSRVKVDKYVRKGRDGRKTRVQEHNRRRPGEGRKHK